MTSSLIQEVNESPLLCSCLPTMCVCLYVSWHLQYSCGVKIVFFNCFLWPDRDISKPWASICGMCMCMCTMQHVTFTDPVSGYCALCLSVSLCAVIHNALQRVKPPHVGSNTDLFQRLHWYSLSPLDLHLDLDLSLGTEQMSVLGGWWWTLRGSSLHPPGYRSVGLCALKSSVINRDGWCGSPGLLIRVFYVNECVFVCLCGCVFTPRWIVCNLCVCVCEVFAGFGMESEFCPQDRKLLCFSVVRLAFCSLTTIRLNCVFFIILIIFWVNRWMIPRGTPRFTLITVQYKELLNDYYYLTFLMISFCHFCLTAWTDNYKSIS